MILYRGTPVPEDKPWPRGAACGFVSPSFEYAFEFACGIHSDPEAKPFEVKYVQEYRLGKQKVLDRYTKKAWRLASDYLQRTGNSRDLTDTLEMWIYAKRDWVEYLKSLGYTAMITGVDFCLFDAHQAELTRRWAVWISEDFRAFRKELPSGRVETWQKESPVMGIYMSKGRWVPAKEEDVP